MEIIINTFPCPIYQVNIKEHDSIKKNVLSLIDSQEKSPFITEDKKNVDSFITNCDWNFWRFNKNVKRKYVDIVYPILLNYKEKIFFEYGYNCVKIYNLWFQQYEKNSTHNWHVHMQCQWSSVYYLEFPPECPATEFVNFLNPNKSFSLNVSEGDYIIFPSFLIHKAPIIKDNSRKTIISTNFDITNDMRYYE